MKSDIIKSAYNWTTSKSDEIEIDTNYYCQTRDIFQARLSKMIDDLLKNSGIEENKIYVISAIAGEIGNNSFDHNIGNWPDIMGIFFTYNFEKNNLEIILADRGQGILKTLKRVKPELKDDFEALKTAFTERISGRFPEARGNGLKFSKENIERENMRLVFISGRAKAELNKKMKITEADENISGCLAILTL
jgi:anti-sigma regulatory factor (Ser/Thr protein kinase)